MNRSRRRTSVALMVLALLSGCSKSDDDNTGPSGQSIAIALAPSAISLAPGGNTTAALAISRSSFTGEVTLASTGAPTGVTVAFSASPTTASSSTVTVTAASTVTPGVYPITITASGTGVTSTTATLTLTVTGTALSFTYCRTIPIWFAVQEGTGQWRQILPSSPGVFAFTFSAQTGGIATVGQGSSTADSYSLNVQYASVDQFKEMAQALCDITGLKAVTVNVVKGGTERADVGLGPSYMLGSASKTNFAFTTVPNGPVDLVASRNGASAAANRVIIRRGLDVPTGTVLPNVDFTTLTEGFVPETRTATVTGGQGSDFVSASGRYDPNIITGLTQPIGLATQLTPTSFTVPVLPASQIVSSDMHSIVADAFALDGSYGYSTEALMRTPHDVTLALPAAPASATINIATTTPFVRPHIAIARQADYASDLTLVMTQSSSGVFSRSFFVGMTGAYFGSTATDFTYPDLSTVAGFSPVWGLKTGSSAFWQLTLAGRTMGPNASVYKNYALDGNVLRYGSRTGSITP